MIDFLASPLAQLLILALVSTLFHHFFMRRGESPTGSGAIAMAIGIFILGALQHMPFPVELLTRLLTLEGLIVWSFIAISYVSSLFRGTFENLIKDPVGCFVAGTWVAGTAILAKLIDMTIPGWHNLALAMGAVTLFIWLWYLKVAIVRYRLLLSSEPDRFKVTGRVLLVAVSTQSVLILGMQLFPGQLPYWLELSFTLLGFGAYVLGLYLIYRSYLSLPSWSLKDDWDSTNCIIHGAMSITGLAAIESKDLPAGIILVTWLWVVSMFLMVELFEIMRLIGRVKQLGWRRGVFTYNVTQWSRNFTFGMFYAFTVQIQGLMSAQISSGLAGITSIQKAITGWGQYGVLILLVVEIGLFLSSNVENVW